jgi:phosphoribosylamine--glycine ligase
MNGRECKVLLIGSGGREHALAWSLSASPLLTRLYAAPGNAGICGLAECVALDPGDHDAVIAFCRGADIGLVVIGPEGPLVAGLADDLQAAGIRAFGPSKRRLSWRAPRGSPKTFAARPAFRRRAMRVSTSLSRPAPILWGRISPS